MKAFFISVLASIVAAIIIYFTAIPKRCGKAVYRYLGKLMHTDIDYVYRTKAEANIDIVNDIVKAKNISLFSSRGDELRRDTFSTIFLKRQQNINIKILLPNPNVDESEYDWTEQREKELKCFDISFGENLLHSQITANINFLKPHTKSDNIELRLYNAPHIGRVLIIDDIVYYTPYLSDKHGRDQAIYKFTVDGALANNYKRLFDQLWSNSIVYVAENSTQEI